MTRASKKKTFKAFLEINKVYFETIVMLALTTASIFVSISANRTMDKQRQLEEAAAAPIINVAPKMNSNSQIESLSIINDGGAVSNLKVRAIPYLEVMATDPMNQDSHYVEMVLPINNRPPERRTYVIMTGSRVGEIAKVNNQNPVDVNTTLALYHDVYYSASGRIDPYMPILQGLTPKYFLTVQYEDVLGNQFLEIFDVEISFYQPYSGGIFLSNVEEIICTISKNSIRYRIAERLLNAKRDDEIIYYDFNDLIVYWGVSGEREVEEDQEIIENSLVDLMETISVAYSNNQFFLRD